MTAYFALYIVIVHVRFIRDQPDSMLRGFVYDALTLSVSYNACCNLSESSMLKIY